MKKLSLSGSPWQIGEQLGEAGKQAWQDKVCHTPLWHRVMREQDSPTLEQFAQMIQQYFPDIWQELEGLASGLEAPFRQVLAWNCRGDLLSSTSDGCTSVAGWTTTGEILVAHNEDGLPELYDDCFLVDVTPLQGVGFLSFAYPGSLCGHTFSVNHCGIVNVINNIRAEERPAGLPRQILARAALSAETLDSAAAILSELPRSGAFHHTLAQVGDSRIISLEATGMGSAIKMISRPFGHANHLIHPERVGDAQKITESSAARQSRVEQQLSATDALSVETILTILSDQHNEALPIYRQSPDDPDQENTLATALYILSRHEIGWQVYRSDRVEPENYGTILVESHYET